MVEHDAGAIRRKALAELVPRRNGHSPQQGRQEEEDEEMKKSRYVVFEAPCDVPSAGLRAGDLVMIRPDHRFPIVVSHYPCEKESREILNALTDLVCRGGTVTPADLRRIVEEAEAEERPLERRRRARLRLV